MSPRQISAWLEHGNALDRMQDARDLYVQLLAASGNEKEVSKHLKAWVEGEAPSAKKERAKMTEDEMKKILDLRNRADAAKPKPTNGQ